MKKKKLLFYAWLAIIVLVLHSCGSSQADDEKSKKFCMTDSLYKMVQYDNVIKIPVTNELVLSGKITVNEDKVVKVFPLASGHVAEVKVSLGDYVEQGQVLAVIHSSDMAGYFNEYNAAQSELNIAKKNLDATEDMYKNGLRSEVEYFTAQKEYQKAQSAFNKISEVLKIYGTQKKDGDQVGSGYVIKSPIPGYIVEKNVNTGMELRPDDGNNIFTISDLKEVWAVANVYETDIAKVKTGYNAAVTTLSYGDKEFTGKIDKVGNILNPETKVLNMKIRLDNPEYLLKPGMFAHITIRYPENREMLSVPSDAVIFDDNKNYVVVFKDKCNVQMKRVTIYKTIDGKSYIQDGDVQEKDIIITRYGLYIFTALKKL